MLKLIEIFCAKLLSPSVRRAWIEIDKAPDFVQSSEASPSARRQCGRCLEIRLERGSYETPAQYLICFVRG